VKYTEQEMSQCPWGGSPGDPTAVGGGSCGGRAGARGTRWSGPTDEEKKMTGKPHGLHPSSNGHKNPCWIRNLKSIVYLLPEPSGNFGRARTRDSFPQVPFQTTSRPEIFLFCNFFTYFFCTFKFILFTFSWLIPQKKLHFIAHREVRNKKVSIGSEPTVERRLIPVGGSRGF